MAASTVAASLFNWLVTACMSVEGDGDPSTGPIVLQSSKRLSKWRELSKGRLISFLCESSIQRLMSSCLDFEPCDEYNSSSGFYFSSLFGSRNAPLNSRQRKINRAACSDNYDLNILLDFLVL